MPLRPNLDKLSGLRQFTPSLAEGMGYGVLVVVLYGLYWKVAQAVRHGRWQPTWRQLAGLTLLLALPLLLTYPYNANDLFRYAMRGRITAVYGGNPYQRTPSTYPQDSLTALTGEWSTVTTPYGPVWELTAAAAAWLTAGVRSPFWLLILLKGVATAAHLAIGWLIWHHSPSSRERTWRTALWLFNPALLLSFVADGHNDSVMLLWLVWGGMVWHKRPLAGMALLCLAPLTKAIGVLPLPFFMVATWRGQPTWGARGRWSAAVVAMGFGLAWLLFRPFGSPMTLFTRLLDEAGAGAGFSPGALFLLWASEKMGWTLTQGWLTAWAAGGALFMLGTAAVGGWWVWHGRSSPWFAAAITLFAYVGQALNFRIWYATWAWPLVLSDPRPSPYLMRLGLWGLLATQLSAVIYNHLWFYQFGRADWPTHVWGVGVTFVLPPLIAWLIPSREKGG